VFAASQEARRPLLFGQLIIMIVYLPIFALTGVEGKLFHPMAFTVVIALLGAMILSITFIPAAVALFIGDKVSEKENRLMAVGQARLRAAAGARDARQAAGHHHRGGGRAAVGPAGHAAGHGVRAQPERGRLRHPGAAHSGHQPHAVGRDAEAAGKHAEGEVSGDRARVRAHRHGRDRVGPDAAEHLRRLHHAQARERVARARRQVARTRAELLAAVQEEVEKLPGNNYEFSQPIQLRFNELISGVRSDVAVKIFGDDMDVLNKTAAEVSETLGKIPARPK
jgi:cobalt-zinc-cadmium resistance protein CzcA